MTNSEFPRTEDASPQAPEADGSPRQYSFRQLCLIGLIFAACAALFLLPIIFFES